MPVHSSIQNADCHEPKHITDAVIADAGKVITPSASENGVSVLRALTPADITGLAATLASLGGGVEKAYGGKTVHNNSTAITFASPASDPTFLTPSDFVQVTGIFESPDVAPNSNVTLGTDSLTIVTAGVYQINFWIDLKSDTNSNIVGIQYGLNGVVSNKRPLSVRTPNNTEPFLASAHAYFAFDVGDVLTLHIAAKLASDITITNGRMSIELVEAT